MQSCQTTSETVYNFLYYDFVQGLTVAIDPKPVIFIGSAKESEPFAEAIQNNLKGEAEVLIWSQIPFELSRATLDTLDSYADKVDFAVFVFSPDDKLEVRGPTFSATRDNVLLELGLFMGKLGRERAFIAQASNLKQPHRVPTDILGLTTATYNHEDYDPSKGNANQVMGFASNNIKRAIKLKGRIPRPIPEPNRRIRGVLERGGTELITVLSDAGFHLGENRHGYINDLKRIIFNGEIIPTKYMYRTPWGSSHWLDICSRETYLFYKNSLDQIRDVSFELAAAIARFMSTSEVDFISVGSGDGLKDNVLLRALSQGLKKEEYIYYYPIDISDALIMQAIPRALGGGIDQSKFKVKALLADFRELRSLQRFYEERPARNVFSVLGNIVGNASESDLIMALADSMLDGDLLLIEFNIDDADPNASVLKEIAYMEHDFTPLAALGISLDKSKFRHELYRNKSILPHTRSVVTTYSDVVIDNRPPVDVRLGVVHHYNFDYFKSNIERRLGVKIVYASRSNGVGLLLASKTT